MRWLWWPTMKRYKVRREQKRWAVVDTTDGSIISTHARKGIAKDVAAMCNSVCFTYGSID